MMKPLYKQPLVEAVILASGILCTVVLIHGVQNFIALGGKPATSQIAQKSNPDLVNVAAGSCEGLGDIDKRGQNGSQDPAKVPTDAFNDFGMVKSAGLTPAPASDKKFGDNISTADRDALHINLDGLVDGSITLANVWSVSSSYRSDSSTAVHKNEVIAISTTPGQVIKTPGSGRMILDGSNLSGMVMYVSDDGVRFANSRNDKPTGQEGYNLYIWGITPDPGLASRYQCANDTLGRQKMPEMHVGDTLGTAKEGFIYLALRDNGAFQDLLDTSWWNGRIKAGDTTGAAASPGGAVVPAGAVEDDVIKTSISTNSVQTKYPNLFQEFDKKRKIIVAGDSNTYNIEFKLDGFMIDKKAVGGQGAKKLAAQVKEFADNSKFALILIGVNEVHNGDSDAANGSLSQFQENLSDIVKKTLDKGIIPVLQTVDDFDKTGDIPKNLTMVNQVIRNVATSNNIPLVVTTDYVDVSFMAPDEHPYHFNLTKGAQLRNQILRLVNDKLDGIKPAGAAAPAATTVSGKVNLTGMRTGQIDLYYLVDASRQLIMANVSDSIGWSFIPTKSNFCMFAYMQTREKNKDGTELAFMSNKVCGLNAGSSNIELNIVSNYSSVPDVSITQVPPNVTIPPSTQSGDTFKLILSGEVDVPKQIRDFLTCANHPVMGSVSNIFAYFAGVKLEVTELGSNFTFTIKGNMPLEQFSGLITNDSKCSFFVREPYR